MKKLTMALATLAVLAIPCIALADITPPVTGADDPNGNTTTGYLLPTSAVVSTVYNLTPGTSIDITDNLARAWKSGGTELQQCDMQTWTQTLRVHASIAQWIKYQFSQTRWDWRVRKPGTYATDCIEFKIHSNDDVVMSFKDFGPLTSSNPLVTSTIPVSYGFARPDVLVGAVDWKPALGDNSTNDINNDANNITLSYADINAVTADGGPSYLLKLWNKIEVAPSTHACEYEDSGVITLTLQTIKRWIDGGSGNYRADQTGC